MEINPILYKGYYYDRDIGLYYLGSRHYDPVIGRFVTADALITTGQGPLSYNMYAYCGNNPVMRSDVGGYFWDIVFDVVSLVSSIVDVCQNPTDPWAWAGLAGDLIDVCVPMVAGIGEVTKAAKTVSNVVEAGDNVIDTAKAVDRVGEAVQEGRKVDFFVTPNGEVLPATRQGFDSNLSKMDYRNGKYYAEDSKGPMRVRIEKHLDDPNFSGSKNPYHSELHFHIDRRIKITTGAFKKKFTGLMEWFR